MFELPADPYEVLGVSKNAQIPEIRFAYRKLVLKCHPDKVTNPALKAQAAEKFEKVQKAYMILSDEKEREKYDDRVSANELERNHAEGQRRRQRRRNSGIKMTQQQTESVGSNREPRSHRYKTTWSDQPGEQGTMRHEMQMNQKQTAHQGDRTANEKRPVPDFQTHVLRLSDENDENGPSTSTIKSRSRKTSRAGILVVHGLFEEQKITAIPDTGAEYNIISGSLVDKLQLRNRMEQPSTRQPLRMANGQYTFTSGGLEASWRFGDDTSRPWKIMFHILEDFVHDLILGNSFLMETQTMSYNKHRLDRIPRPINALSVLRVNLLGVPSQRLRGFVDDAEILALPDSGSEPNLVSFEFVRAQGWQHKMNTQDTRLLQFADGSTTESEGSIRGRWQFVQKSNRRRTSVFADFHILRGCAYDVIIGQDILEETDAFLKYEDDFLYIESTLASAAMNLVWFAPKKAKKAPPPPNTDFSINVELQRRALADQSIRRLPLGPERENARRKEEANRQLFDQQQESARLTIPPSANLPNFRPAWIPPALPRDEPTMSRFIELQEAQRLHNGSRV
ncbi:DnaJ domain-containing protein [Pestalotiopsis sp. NC0098]|nr:DnaJ domain-containing protein [Pestalotiopsis sp. NC0098]